MAFRKPQLFENHRLHSSLQQHLFPSNVNIFTKGKKNTDYFSHPETLNFMENMTLNDLSCESKRHSFLLGHTILELLQAKWKEQNS